MRTRFRTPFVTVKVEGALLPADLLQRIAEGDKELGGLKPTDYHLAPSEKLNEAISRSWNRLRGVWTAFKHECERVAEMDGRGTTETRERWLLPLFQELGYGRLTAQRYEIDGKGYPISHGWGHVPIHLTSFKFDIDRRTDGVAGASCGSPHSMTQELLNRSDDHLWAFLSNGLRLRILRDNASLTRQAYVEFDLEAMMEGEAYADFSLLWMLCHQSRVEAEEQEECWLERWSKAAQEEGTRALDALRHGVEQAIAALGSGFIAHPANGDLREKLRVGTLDKQDFYRQLLRLVYRLIFLFTAEDRELLFDPEAPEEARERYLRFYSASSLRLLAEQRRGGRHPDRYRALRLIMQILGCDEGEPILALPALGSFLWAEDAVPDLGGDLANRDLLDAVRALTFIEQNGIRRAVDYKHLGPEELGGIYESLLELQPQLNLDAQTFVLQAVAGSERKTTGSYYTPPSLIASLLNTALEPLLDEAERQNDPEAALLNLKVCDPAVGSGHFLIAAAHRIAARLASIRTGDSHPAPEAIRTALREVIGRCVYGVDLNEMAVELCKVNLWLEALEPGKPLSFLDHRIQHGNGLLGATPAALKAGVPDEVFKPLTGDDKAFCAEHKKANRDFRKSGQFDLFEDQPWMHAGNIARMMTSLNDFSDGTVEGERRKKEAYEQAVRSANYAAGKLLADAWCAAFVWEKRQTNELPFPITSNTLQKIEVNPYHTPEWMRSEIEQLAEQYRFFHWHLAFPDVFGWPKADETPDDATAGWMGGFDCVLGNPPWEKVKIQEKEWFAAYRPDIAEARNKAARTKMIRALEHEDPALHDAFLEAKRQAEGESLLLRSSLYPLCGRGDINTYQIFAERFRTLQAPTGRVGIIVPSGIASDATTQFFFRDLMETRQLASLYDFENRRGIFAGVHRSFKFCLLTLTGAGRPATQGADFVFFAQATSDLKEEDRHFTLTAEEIALLNPNTRTCPIFRSKRDAELTKAIYRRVPVLIQEGSPDVNPWGIEFSTMFHMSGDSNFFHTREQLEEEGFYLEGSHFVRGSERYLPLYEAKMFHHFNHRFGDYDDQPAGSKSTQLPDVSDGRLQDATYSVQPRYWVDERVVTGELSETPLSGWVPAFRKTANATNERTLISSLLPKSAINDKAPFFVLPKEQLGCTYALVANLNSFVCDFAARQKISATDLSHFFVKQFPILPPEAYAKPCFWSSKETLAEWLMPRVLELSYTTWDLEPFARDCGYYGDPFRWDETRRYLLCAELDAAFFHLYGIRRSDVDYIMETFPIVKRKDVKQHGHYRTKQTILDVYDRLAQATEAGTPYQTLLDPAPASPQVAHPSRRMAA